MSRRAERRGLLFDALYSEFCESERSPRLAFWKPPTGSGCGGRRARPDHRESPGRRGLFLSLPHLPTLLRLLRCPCFPRSRDQEVLAFFSGLESGSHPLRCESPTSPSFRGIFWIAIFGGYRTSRATPAYLTAAPSAIE